MCLLLQIYGHYKLLNSLDLITDISSKISFFLVSFFPVSYTHLDVYKRQVLDVRWWKSILVKEKKQINNIFQNLR